MTQNEDVPVWKQCGKQHTWVFFANSCTVAHGWKSYVLRSTFAPLIVSNHCWPSAVLSLLAKHPCSYGCKPVFPRHASYQSHTACQCAAASNRACTTAIFSRVHDCMTSIFPARQSWSSRSRHSYSLFAWAIDAASRRSRSWKYWAYPDILCPPSDFVDAAARVGLLIYVYVRHTALAGQVCSSEQYRKIESESGLPVQHLHCADLSFPNSTGKKSKYEKNE